MNKCRAWIFAMIIASVLTEERAHAGWVSQTINLVSGETVEGMSFVDDQRGFALTQTSSASRVQGTTDGGATWSVLASGGLLTSDSFSAKSIQFSTVTDGWLTLAEGPLLRTTDGGVTWSPVVTALVGFSPSSTQEVHLVHLQGAQTIWATGFGYENGQQRMLTRSTDGGATWEIMSTGGRRFDSFSLAFGSANNGTIAGSELIVTNDAGETWFVPRMDESPGTINKVFYQNAQTIWLSAPGGALLRSTDSGANFLRFEPPTIADLNALLVTQGGEVFLGGNEGGTGWLLRSPNGGLTWKRSTLPTYSLGGTPAFTPVRSFAELPNGTILAGARAVLRLDDSGSPAIRVATLQPGVVGQPYSFRFEAEGGTAPYVWSIVGTAPGGLTLNPATGILSGSPTTSNPAAFSVKVTDVEGDSDTLAGVQLANVSAPLTFASSTLKPVKHRRTFWQSLAVAGGNRPYTATVLSGALPVGVTVDRNGVLAGTPQDTGTFTATLELADSSAIPQRATASLSLTVEPLAQETWDVQHAHNYMNAIHFFDENEGFVAGLDGVLLRTLDGGRTWSRGSFLPVAGTGIREMAFLGDTGILTTDVGEYRTTDRGQTFSLVEFTSPDVLGQVQPRVHIHSPILAFLVNEKIARSTDGGALFGATTLVPPLGSNQIIWDLDMADATTGWAVGNDKSVYKTTDGGLTWNAFSVNGLTDNTSIPATVDLLSVAAVGERIWFTTTFASGGSGMRIFRSVDGGVTWSFSHALPTTGELREIRFLEDGQTGWASGFDRDSIARTTNGGQTWNTIYTRAGDVSNFYFLDSQRGWGLFNDVSRIVNNTATDFQSSIWKTTNGGQTWEIQYGFPLQDNKTSTSQIGVGESVSYGPTLAAITFPSARRGFALSQDSFARSLGSADVLRTDNGGATWDFVTKLPRGTHILFTSEQVGWVTNSATGSLPPYQTTDGGQTWYTRPDMPSLGTVYDLFFVDSQHGWLSHVGGALERTTDGGETWTNLQPSLFPSNRAFLVHFTDRQNGWRLYSGFSQVSRTSDGGATWIDTPVSPAQGLPSGAFFNDLYASDAQTAWVVGRSGRISSTTNGGVTWNDIALLSPAPTMGRVLFQGCGRGYAIGNDVPAGQAAGGPYLAETLTGEFTPSGFNILPINKHNALAIDSPDSANLWIHGDMGLAVKRSAATTALFISTEEVPVGREGQLYNEPLTLQNAVGTVTWTVCGGNLPQGVLLTPQGTLSGTPEEAGSWTFTAGASDTSGNTAARRLFLTIQPAQGPSIVTETLPAATPDQDYTASLEATGSTAPYRWRITEGILPPGLQLLSSGTIAGRTRLAGTYTFTLEVQDNRTPRGFTEKEFTLLVEQSDVPTLDVWMAR